MTEDTTNVTAEYQAAYDMRAAMIQSLFEILQNANAHFLQGELEKYFWALYLVRMRIEPYLNMSEKEEMNSYESSIAPIIGLFKAELRTMENKELLVKVLRIKKDIPNRLRAYDNSIMFLLKKYGFLIPPKSDNTKLIG